MERIASFCADHTKLTAACIWSCQDGDVLTCIILHYNFDNDDRYGAVYVSDAVTFTSM